jgi:hypothetical protein
MPVDRMKYYCCEPHRRDALLSRSDLNGIDYLEVFDDTSLPEGQRQRTLFVHFVHPQGSLQLDERNVRLLGGERIRDIRVVQADLGMHPQSGSAQATLKVTLDRAGDFSTYTLQLVPFPPESAQLAHFDPLMCAVDFSFKVNCPSDFDCLQPQGESSIRDQPPVIDYLARDFNSLRQLLLDRMALLLPGWQERNPADLGITLVEMLAYVGDMLSYQQDAVATEAYLNTARRRVSVKRHARLVDYFMHDGCNARAWVQVRLKSNAPAEGVLLKSVPYDQLDLTPQDELSRPRFLSRCRAGDVVSPAELPEILKQQPIVFEPLHDQMLYPDHNELPFYTWGERRCCLPVGACKATLRGHYPHLQAGFVLVLQELRGPRSGELEDADLRHRHAVRLVNVRLSEDPLGGSFEPVPNNMPVPVTEIEWHADDALPFPLCISAEADEAHQGQFIPQVSLALGNIVLADHGLSRRGEPLQPVPPGELVRLPHSLSQVPGQSQGTLTSPACQADQLEILPARFEPRLQETPITQAASYQTGGAPFSSAKAALQVDAHRALPQIVLRDQSAETWRARLDLLSSGRGSRRFTVEIEADGTTRLRFGDGRHGQRPAPHSVFTPVYRLGNGSAGNLGIGGLAHIVTQDAAIERISNPLPAAGGQDPESAEAVRQNAPYAYLQQKRAVTQDDYAQLSARMAGIQQAAATMRWTGSWHTVYISADRFGGAPVDQDFENDLRRYLEPFRLAGHDLEIDRPRAVALLLAITVQVKPDYFRSSVRSGLLEVFNNRTLANGRKGLFHPDNFSFGQTVYLSPFIAAAQAVEGVESVAVTLFERMSAPDLHPVELGYLQLNRLEIARLDNDPNFPERGVFRLSLEGGK